MLDPDHIAWSKSLFNSLNEGGTWAVPRSGLIFRRKGDKLVATKSIPGFDPEMQEADIEAIAAHFKAAGIEVVL